MKKLISISAFVSLLIVSINSFAQVSGYNFTQSVSSYIELFADTVVAVSTSQSAATSSDESNLVNQIYINNRLPFTFAFNKENYTNIVISSNGFITFGSSYPSPSNQRCIENNDPYEGCISAFSESIYGIFQTTGSKTAGSNIITGVVNFSGVMVGKYIFETFEQDIPPGTVVTSFDVNAGTITMSAASLHGNNSNTSVSISSGSIIRGTTGAPGSYIHTIQFQNFRRYPTGPWENFNFQIKLYETSNKIEIIYGDCQKNNFSLNYYPQVGLRGADNTDFNHRIIYKDWTISEAASENSQNCYINQYTVPPFGLIYTWIPPVPFTTDAGVSGSFLGFASQIFIMGNSYDLSAVAKNEGTAIQNSIPVYYKENSNPPIGPVNTLSSLGIYETENVLFTGGLKFTPTTAGVHKIKVYTSLAGDENQLNDTAILTVNVQQKITTYPYLNTFSDPDDNWTVLLENSSGYYPLWRRSICINADNKIDSAITANFFLCESGRREILRSPIMDISSLENPVLNFYISCQNYLTHEDTLEVLVSTDAGMTFFSTSTIYNKSHNSVPSLSTVAQGNSDLFYPLYDSAWRHETLSLENVSGSNNLIIGFRGKSDNGNALWIDNVIVSGSNGYCNDVVTSAGNYNCNSLLDINFIDLSSANLINIQKVSYKEPHEKFINTEDLKSVLQRQSGSVKVNSGIQNDNPTGGNITITQHNNDAAVIGAGISDTMGITTSDGSTFIPDEVYEDYWFTATYTGNDYLGYADYNVSIDITSLTFGNPNKIYIVKRTDMSAKWIPLNTIYSGGKLIASGLSRFSDFALAGDSISNPLPVELSSFIANISERNVTLNWTTVSELNNAGFDIEKSKVKGQTSIEWERVSFVKGNGTINSTINYSFTDKNLFTGKYKYRLKQIDFNGNFEYYNLSNEVNVGIPSKFELSQNYPNPFNPSTKINYDLPFDGKVNITLFDISGREVAIILNENKTAGYYSVNFNAWNLSSGVYFYRINAETSGQNYIVTKKMMLLK